MPSTFVVTGAGGFVGARLMAALGGRATPLSMREAGWLERAGEGAIPERCGVFHLAGRVHDARATQSDYQRDNAEKSRALARLCALRRVERIVFLSTIKVNGEETGSRPFTPADPPRPQDDYARSKLGAEEALRDECGKSGIELVVLRSPLVYGRGAAGNLRALLRLADTPWPLPFAALSNARSFIHVDDLVAALLAAMASERAAGRTYLLAHRQAPSTADLVTRLRSRLGREARLFALPPAWIEAAAGLLGQGSRAARLTRSLVVDPSFAEAELQWRAQRSIDEALGDLVAGHREGAA